MEGLESSGQSITSIDYTLVRYNQDIKILQEEILTLYFDLFMFNISLFMINAKYAWDVSLNVIIIGLLIISVLASYFNCRRITLTHVSLVELIDALACSTELMAILFYYNNLGHFFLPTSITCFVGFFYYFMLKVKNFLTR